MCFQMSQKALIKENDSLPQVPWASNPRQSKSEAKDPQVSEPFESHCFDSTICSLSSKWGFFWSMQKKLSILLLLKKPIN